MNKEFPDGYFIVHPEKFMDAFMNGEICPRCTHFEDDEFCETYCLYGDCYDEK